MSESTTTPRDLAAAVATVDDRIVSMIGAAGTVGSREDFRALFIGLPVSADEAFDYIDACTVQITRLVESGNHALEAIPGVMLRMFAVALMVEGE